MNPTALAIALVIVGAVGGKLLIRRFPTVSYTQMFCAISAWLAGTLLVVGRTTSAFWYYTGLVVAVTMGTLSGPRVSPSCGHPAHRLDLR